MKMTTCRVLFLCALCVSAWCIGAVMAADKSPKDVAAATVKKLHMKVGDLARYYEGLFQNASDVSASLFTAVQTAKATKNVTGVTDDVKNALQKLENKISTERGATEKLLRPMGASVMTKMINELNATANRDEIASDAMLKIARQMTVRPTSVEKAIAGVNRVLNETNKVEELNNSTDKSEKQEVNHKINLVKSELQKSLASLQAIKTASLGAREWQDQLFLQFEGSFMVASQITSFFLAFTLVAAAVICT